MKLEDTIQMMTSKDHKERLKAEYYQTKIRFDKLSATLEKIRIGEIDFIPKDSCKLLEAQRRIMFEYLSILVTRAMTEGIELEEMTKWVIEK